MARWLEELSDLDFEIHHRSGSKHQNAYALSHGQCLQCGRAAESETDACDQGVTPDSTSSDPMGCSTLQEDCTSTENTWIPSWSEEELQHLQLADSDLHRTMFWLNNQCLPDHCSRDASTTLKSLWAERPQLRMINATGTSTCPKS